ncbi:Sedlin, N-terminal conserved region containing protein [Novymonas esmeraldas]|uniref:Sedlin, N-terminal conserved region containing protein n=1 Tax=Novymonas esmeraldas TaxID=1808958 RepID=A0AAW0EJU9_9TRYP
MSLEVWAVAALAVVDSEGTPLLLRTYTSPKEVLNAAAAPLHAHLYVGPEDVIKLHFVLFASLDRCEEMRDLAVPSPLMAVRGVGGEASRTAAKADGAATFGTSSATGSAAVTANNSLTASALNASSVAGNAARLMSPTTDARFLGKLLESHRLRSYGFRSATGIHTLLVTVGGDAPADAVVPLCRAVYECASAALCNPFRSPSQSWRAQDVLLGGGSPSSAPQEERQQVGEGEEEAEEERQAPSQVPPRGRGGVGAASRLSLPPGAAEWSWPRPAPTSVAALTAEPTLALSRTFNTQIEGLLSSFTVTARSCIVR